jgi:putative lipase involved disintegration of autophagic bodies
MMKAFLISLVALLVVSCSSRDKIPDDILPQPRMQALVWDMLRTDEFVTNYIRNDSVHNKKDESTRLYEQVFRIHKTNRDQFKKSIIFYNGHPDLLKGVFDSLENRKNSVLLDTRKKPGIPDSAHKKLKLNLPKRIQ